jgi:tRNA (guanine9-N1)-methyltransferase
MIKWQECKDWNQAFLDVIPQRKLKPANSPNQADSAADEESSDDELVNDEPDADSAAQETEKTGPLEDKASDEPAVK